MRYFICLIIVSFVAHGQNDSLLRQFNLDKNKLNHRGMIVLTSWAGLNLAGGACGYALSDNETDKSFQLMNAAWGAVNLGIALPGLLSRQQSNQNLEETQKGQSKIEKIFLINAALDVVYIGGGLYLREYGSQQSPGTRHDRCIGYGNSIVFQGAGLLVFDATMTLLNRRHRKKKLDPFLQNAKLGIGPGGVSFRYRF